MNTEDLFVFPNNVNIESKVRASSRDYLKIGGIVFILANMFIIFFGISLANRNNWPMWLPITAIIILNIILLIFILRFGVFNEASLEREHKEEQSSNFNMYCKIVSISPIKHHEYNNLSIPIYQYSNGYIFTLLGFTHGTNNSRKTKGNEIIMTKLYRNCYKEGINLSVYCGTENIETSVEARAQMKKIAMCDDPSLANTVSRLNKAVYDLSAQEASVECFYVILKGKSQNSVHSICSVINSLLIDLDTINNSFRPLRLCGEEEYVNLIKRFNSLGGIDTAKIKIDNMGDNALDFNEVRIYMVEYENGDVLVNNKIIDEHLKPLKRMN